MESLTRHKNGIGRMMQESLKALIWVPPTAFSSKPRINFRGIGWIVCGFLAIFCIVTLFLASEAKETRKFSTQEESKKMPHDSPTASGAIQEPSGVDPLLGARIHSGGVAQGGREGGEREKFNTSMVIPRGEDSSTTLPPGTKISIKLTDAATVTGRAIPVIGVVTASVMTDSSVAIPEDSKIFGEATLDSDSERASIVLKSILFSDGRSKALSALALGADNQAGVSGDFHSDGLKNTAGSMVSRFVSGFAQGAVSRGAFGGSPGGIQNGLFQGLADTAKERADAWGQDMKRPREWIELAAGTRFQAILSQPFIYRDPGGIY